MKLEVSREYLNRKLNIVLEGNHLQTKLLKNYKNVEKQKTCKIRLETIQVNRLEQSQNRESEH